MGNNRFRLSDMIPNAWFHKLKDMSKTKNHVNNNNNTDLSKQKPKPKQPHHFNPRKSYYFTRDLIPIDGPYVSKDPARKSSKKRYSPRKKILSPPKVGTSSVSAGCRCRETIWSKPDSPPPGCSASSSSFSFFDDEESSSPTELIKSELEIELELPPIITKPAKFNDMVNDIKKKKKSRSPKINSNNSKNSGLVRKFGAHSPGVRLRMNSPKIRNKKIQGLTRKSVSSTSSSSSLSESFAVVKSSFDPQRDFRESMVEMILENNIRESKDLEDLLACYLSLNYDGYHDLIIKVFKQIWFDLNDVQIKS